MRRTGAAAQRAGMKDSATEDDSGDGLTPYAKAVRAKTSGKAGSASSKQSLHSSQMSLTLKSNTTKSAASSGKPMADDDMAAALDMFEKPKSMSI